MLSVSEMAAAMAPARLLPSHAAGLAAELLPYCVIFLLTLVPWIMVAIRRRSGDGKRRQASSSSLSMELPLPPGPPFSLPFLGHCLQVGADQITARKMAKLAETYGDIFLLKMGRRNLVFISSPAIAKEMLHTKGVQFGSRARSVVTDIFTGAGQDLVFADYGPHWRRARRILTLPFFTSQAVQHRWRPAMEDESELLIGRLERKPEAFTRGAVLRESLHLMIYNSLYRVAFGRRFESEDEPLYVRLKGLNDQRSRLMQSLAYNYGDFFPALCSLSFIRGYLQTCRAVKEARENMYKDFVLSRVRELNGLNDLLEEEKKTLGIDHILVALEDKEIKEESMLYFIENLNAAGVDTILITLEWAIAELVNNPSIQEKVYQELSSSRSTGEPKDNEAHSTVVGDTNQILMLPYLDAVLKETMRMHPTTPFVVPHTNLEKEELGGYRIPSKSRVMVNAWWMANNPKWWNNPQKFNPDRFMDIQQEGTLEMHGNHFKFLPFGSGRRQCPGIVVALPIIKITLAKLLLSFELLSPQSTTHRCEKASRDLNDAPLLDLTERDSQFLLPMAISPKVLLKRRNHS